ncbi:MAG: class I SAM-dependent RNA methyltransferase [Clostridia bacterium]|nr:class I SAM-dependent RNA methyltransferase [Clostridia bacterium]
METLTYIAPCLFGIEGILGDELRRMGAENVRPQTGRVLFDGDLAIGIRANLLSRYAERIGLVLGQFRAVTFDELFEQVKALPWERWIGQRDRFPVKGWSLDSVLHSVPDCQKIVKKAVVERLKTRYALSWFEETGALYQIQFTIMKNNVTVFLDTSGEGLHKRGYRREAGGAPLKETLAAAMVDVTKARLSPLVIDPCCGSGTLLIEAALAARRIAPGKNRRFISQEWPQLPSSLWQSEREHAVSLERPDQPFEARGFDIDPAAVQLTKANAIKAGVGDCVTAEQRELRTFTRPDGRCVVLCNPPYGERLLDQQAAQEIIRTMGRVFAPSLDCRYAIISPDEQFESLFGRPAVKRRKLYNGMLRCQLYLF